MRYLDVSTFSVGCVCGAAPVQAYQFDFVALGRYGAKGFHGF
jgi:hypothetical protein